MNTPITHHPDDRLLMAYSAGALPEAFSLMIAAHVSLCDACRAQVGAFDAIGGALLEEAGAEMPDDSLAATLAALETDPAPEPSPARPAPDGTEPPDPLPQPLRDYIGGGLSAVRWRPVGMGVKQAILTSSREASARLLHIPAGTAIPDHGHRGTELTMVLQGAFSDEVDHFSRGDVETADASLVHSPIADIGSECICLAVTDAPLRFQGLLPRLIQPFLRI